VAGQAEVTARVKHAFGSRPGVRTEELDGLTVSAADWWFNLRPSNTEPLLRLNVEADSETAMAALRDEVLAMVRPASPAAAGGQASPAAAGGQASKDT
jgi:phosphomannomutase